MSGFTLFAQNNVTVKCLDKYGKVTRISYIHNKASVIMVEGLLKFLSGAFNPSKYNPNYNQVTNDEANGYIPVELRFGHIGIEMINREGQTPELDGSLDEKHHFINYDQLKIPTFDEFKLQEEIDYLNPSFGRSPLTFESVEFTTFDDPNNSMGLLFQTFIPAGRLVGFDDEDAQGHPVRKYFTDKLWAEIGSTDYEGKGWTYWNPYTHEYEAIFTEMGLYSGTGRLLARVLFDGDVVLDENKNLVFSNQEDNNNPIVQSDSSSIAVEWRIGITSIGQNDELISGADLKNFAEGIPDGQILKIPPTAGKNYRVEGTYYDQNGDSYPIKEIQVQTPNN